MRASDALATVNVKPPVIFSIGPPRESSATFGVMVTWRSARSALRITYARFTNEAPTMQRDARLARKNLVWQFAV